ncbi:MAG TPA: hypothetical protein VI160_09400 [Gemmatimonadales bacterium]
MRLSSLAVGIGLVLAAACDTSLSPQVASSSGEGGNGAATHLVFTVQPSNAASTVAISPSIQVSAENGAGVTDTGYSGFVTLAIGTNPAGGTLSGTVSVSAIAGVATFTDISIDSAGTGYTLVATSGSLTQRISSAFNITP